MFAAPPADGREDAGQFAPAALPVAEHQLGEHPDAEAAPAVFEFDLVGIAAPGLVDRGEGEAMVPDAYRPAVLVGVDLGGAEV